MRRENNQRRSQIGSDKELDNEGSEEDETSQHWLSETLPSAASPQIVINTIKQMKPTNKSNFSKYEEELMAVVS